MFWWNLAFIAIAGYATLTIGIDRGSARIESDNEKARRP
ncbi:hypothetical protein V1291_005347 [Nitrobacteraceae bacterium AZCC 1564]